MSLIRIQEQVLSLQVDIQSDLYAFSACRGPSGKDRVLVLVDGVPLQMLPDTGASVTITTDHLTASCVRQVPIPYLRLMQEYLPMGQAIH